MLDSAARTGRYLKQTGRRDLTPRQRRRDDKKALAQSQEAVARREGVSAIRLRAGEARKARLAGLTPKS
jgi:hypothetical protein